MQPRDHRRRPGAAVLEKPADENGKAKMKIDGKPTSRAAFADLTNVAGSKGVVEKAEPESARVLQEQRTSTGSFESAMSASAQPEWVLSLHERDQPDAEDPQSVAEYVRDIYQYLREREAHGRVGDYMQQQEDLTEKMRAILIDWLVEVHWKFKLQAETLYLTVHLLDTYLSKKQVKRQKLQLVGVTCMLLASKHEEIYPPEIKDFVHVTDRAYTREDILEMEVQILNTLGFQLTSPSARQFLTRYLKLMPPNGAEHAALAEYALELSLVNYRSMRHPPSHIGAASLLLANKILKISPAWPATMNVATGYTEAHIKSCAKELCSLLQQAEKASLQAVRKKFSQATYHRVAKMVA